MVLFEKAPLGVKLGWPGSIVKVPCTCVGRTQKKDRGSGGEGSRKFIHKICGVEGPNGVDLYPG